MSLEKGEFTSLIFPKPDDEKITRFITFATKNALVDIVCLKRNEDKLDTSRYSPVALKRQQKYDRLAQLRKEMRESDVVVVRKKHIT